MTNEEIELLKRCFPRCDEKCKYFAVCPLIQCTTMSDEWVCPAYGDLQVLIEKLQDQEFDRALAAHTLNME